MNIWVANERVPEIERYIRTVNERLRSTASTFPFVRNLPQLIGTMVYNCVFWLNSFPHKDGVHLRFSPRTILEELPADIQGLATAPTSSYLFHTAPGCKKLCKE